MRNLFYISILWYMVFTNVIMAQSSTEIGGEVNTKANFDLDKSEKIWSRTTFRLKLNNELNENANAYANLKMYSTETSQFDWRLSEAYIDYYSGKLDLRGGVQIISWGTGYLINPTDNINPYDVSEREAFIPEERIGVTAMRLKYYPLDNFVLTGVYIPYFIPALETSALPEKTLKNSEYAFKLTAQSIMGSDFSVSYFKGKEDYPWINGKYRDVQIFGGDLIGTIGEAALWAEGAYSEPDTGDSYYQIIAGGEYTFENDLYCLGQFYHRNYTDAKENCLMGVLRYPFMDIHELQFGMAYETENKIFIFFPEVTLSLTDAASLAISSVFYKGDTAGSFISQIKDMISVELEYSF